MSQELLPIGVKRDGSYYMNIQWVSHTEPDPKFWACNLLTQDMERNGGTFGCNTFGPANIVLGFFGEEQTVGRLKVYKNVGATISVIEELAAALDIYYCDTDEPAEKLRTFDDKVDSVEWKHIMKAPLKEEFGWEEIVFDKPVKAKYLRVDLVENRSETIDWVEISKILAFEK